MDVNFSAQGPPDVVLPEPDPAVSADLAAAGGDPVGVADVVGANPLLLAGWAALGDIAAGQSGSSRAIEAYAYYRVGYHRGLDALRKNGWKGSGFVRWTAESNRGFLRCLQGLGRMAAVIGEDLEAERCEQFLVQLDPNGPWAT